MIDAKHVHKLLECKYDFKHWIKDVISSFNFKDGIDYISYRYDNNGEQIIDNNGRTRKRAGRKGKKARRARTSS